MHDVWLDYFRDKKEQVLGLRSGDKLGYDNGYLLSPRGDKIASVSTKMRDRIYEMENKGYLVSEAEASFVLAWRPREEPNEVAVCLANMVLKK